MTGHAAARPRARTRLLALPVAVLMGLSIAGTGLQPAAASPTAVVSIGGSARAGSPVAIQAGLNIGDDLQKTLLKFAAQKLLGFAFNKLGLDALLGDKDGAKLDELKAQLTQITAQIKILQDSLNQISTDLAKLALEGFTVPLGATVSKIKSLYMDFYVPALDALTSYVTQDLQVSNAGETCDAVAACTAARDHYDVLRADFLRQFTAEGPASYNIQIHDALVPGAIKDSVMSAYGLYLAKSGTGFLNSTDSDAIMNFYNYWANYEALAAWMKAQWNSDRFVLDPTAFDKFLTEQVYGYQEQERATLPPKIPASTVIVLPANAALRTNNTSNLPMWGVPSAGLAYAMWDPSKNTVGVPYAISYMNFTTGFKDWKVPSRAELDALLSRGPTSTNGLEFVLSLDSEWARVRPVLAGTPYIWTAQGAGLPSWKGSPAITCENFNGVSYVPVATFTDYVHTAVGPVTNSLSGYPAGYQNYNRPDLGIGKIQTYLKPPATVQDVINACRAILNDDIAKALNPPLPTNFAILLATRSTGSVNYLP